MSAARVTLIWLVIAGAAILFTVAGTPATVAGQASTTTGVAVCVDPHTALFNPCAHLDTTQVRDTRVPVSAECDEVVAHIYATQTYQGTPDEQACVGEEDDPRVGLALDYGMTADQYAAAERAQR